MPQASPTSRIPLSPRAGFPVLLSPCAEEMRPPQAGAGLASSAPYLGMLFAAVFAMSSGGVLFALMPDETPLFMRVAWRLSVASAVQAVGFARDWHRADAALRERWLACVPMQVLNGVILAVHFWSFAASISWTSYANSMLIVSCVPMVFVGQALLLWLAGMTLRRWIRLTRGKGVGSGSGVGGSGGGSARLEGESLQMAPDALPLPHFSFDAPPALAAPRSAPRSSVDHALAFLSSGSRDPLAPLPPTALEVLGACTALAGVAALIILTGRERAAAAAGGGEGGGASGHIRPPALRGDLVALLSALCMAAYLNIGRAQRAWMPLWMYACPVTTVAAVVAAAASLTLERGTSAGMAGDAALFGWLSSPRSAALALAAGLVPTILGHTLANLALGHVHPLIVSVIQLLQPVIGSFYAYAAGVAGPPSAVVAWAAPLILGGIALVVSGSRGSPCPCPRACRAAAAAQSASEGQLVSDGEGGVVGEVAAAAAPAARAHAVRASSAWHTDVTIAGGGVVWVSS